jgi:hypothetical protein
MNEAKKGVSVFMLRGKMHAWASPEKRKGASPIV